MHWILNVVSTSVAACLLVGCDKPERSPKSLEITSERSALSMRECVGSPEGERIFPGLRPIAVRAPPTNSIFLASDGTQIGIYTELLEPNALVVRSPRRLDDAQVRFLRDCAADD